MSGHTYLAERRIAVAGAGIGGLAFAAMAGARGAEVTVFDQFDTPAPVGSGLVIQPVGQEVLRRIGADQALALGRPINRMVGHEVRTGQRVLDVAYDARRGERFGLAIHRASLFQALLDAASQAGATIVPGARVTDRDGQRLILDGDKTTDAFDLIVDAAGAGSPLSRLEGRALPYGAIWGTVPWPDTALPPDELTQRYRSASRMIGVLPIGRLPDGDTDMAAVFWSLGPGEYKAWREAPLAAWKEEATALWPEVAPFLDQIEGHDQMTYAQYSHGTLSNPTDDGLAHIGDAAHRASPQLGQGANMALLDAAALADALALYHHLPDALSTYAKARRWHVFVYQAMSAAFTPQYQSDSTVQPALRDWVFAPLVRLPLVPRVLSRLVCGDLIPPYGSLPPGMGDRHSPSDPPG